MTESALVTNLVNAGVGGMVIIVVVLFLKFLSTEREKSSTQHDTMMKFIADQRTDNNQANVKAAEIIAIAQVKAAEQVAIAQVKSSDQTATAQAKAAEQTAGSYAQVADAMKELAVVIGQLRDSHVAHDIAMNMALENMRKAKAAAARKKGL